MKKGLNAYQIKIIAMFAMVLDHLAHIVILMPISQNAALSIATAMNVIGRITMPIMCFFIAQGYYHTTNLKRYFIRLFVFAIISQVPYYLYDVQNIHTNLWDFIKYNVFHLNVIYTLFMGLLALTIAKSNINIILKAIGVVFAVYATYYSDWRLYGVIWVLIFGVFYGNFTKQMVAFLTVAIIRCYMYHAGNVHSFALQLCTLLAIPVLYLYNGERGRKSKYGFYIFYPLHLLILSVIRMFMIL